MPTATATTFPVRPNRFPKPYPVHYPSASYLSPTNNTLRSSISARNLGGLVTPRPARILPAAKAVSRADDSAPSGKSVENALKLLGVPETASFNEILRAKDSIVAACKDNEDAVAQAGIRCLLIPSYGRVGSVD